MHILPNDVDPSKCALAATIIWLLGFTSVLCWSILQVPDGGGHAAWVPDVFCRETCLVVRHHRQSCRKLRTTIANFQPRSPCAHSYSPYRPSSGRSPSSSSQPRAPRHTAAFPSRDACAGAGGAAGGAAGRGPRSTSLTTWRRHIHCCGVRTTAIAMTSAEKASR